MPQRFLRDLRRACDAELADVQAGAQAEFATTAAADEFTGAADAFLRRGKRTRAVAAGAGWLAGGGDERPARRLVRLCGAIEIYQASALVHDDIIDQALTRRSLPTLHRSFAALHQANGWSGEGDVWGAHAAILLGDYLLALAQDRAGLAALECPRPAAVNERWGHMTREVALGQYLDIRGEVAIDAPAPARSALAVATHKSARYSVVHPTALGALAAGADDALVARLDAVTEPWGIAFQLRDDDLGVFGDPLVTGKPSGDDLREGKRTLLVALTLQRLSSADADWFRAQLGKPALSNDAVNRARQLIIECGARTAHERRIDHYLRAGEQALAGCTDLPRIGLAALRHLGNALVRRDR